MIPQHLQQTCMGAVSQSGPIPPKPPRLSTHINPDVDILSVNWGYNAACEIVDANDKPSPLTLWMDEKGLVVGFDVDGLSKVLADAGYRLEKLP